MTNRIDDIDAQILRLLQANGRMKRSKIAEAVGLSVPSVSDRMRKLEARGTILGYHALVNTRRLPLDITAFIRVMVNDSAHYREFVEHATALDEVQEVHSITGTGSHILKIRTRNASSLERLLSRIQGWPGVHGTQTSIVLSSFKETLAVPIHPIERSLFSNGKA